MLGRSWFLQHAKLKFAHLQTCQYSIPFQPLFKATISEKISENFWQRISVNISFDLLTTVLMKSSIILNVTTCRMVKVNRRFAGRFCLNFQGLRISQGKTQCQAGSKHTSPHYHRIALSFISACLLSEFKTALL